VQANIAGDNARKTFWGGQRLFSESLRLKIECHTQLWLSAGQRKGV
jgi:hypothetical protein